MDEVFGFLLLCGIVVGGWVLGIVGFVRAGRALREVAALRERLRGLVDARGTTVAADPEVPATPAGEPIAAGVVPPTPGVFPWAGSSESPRPASAIAAALGSAPAAGGMPGPSTPDGTPRGTPEADQDRPSSINTDPDSRAPPGSVPPAGASIHRPASVPPKRSLEDLLTARWGVWAGAVALLMAGVFLIRYAVEQSLLGPEIRCAMGFVLGVALIAGADWTRRRRDMNPQVPPALAAGGVAVLFGAAYGTGVLYELVPPLVAFVLLAAVSFAAMLLSLRFGQLVAAIGVVGAYASPALVETSDPSLPGLFAYLLFVMAAALAVVRYTAWVWLGWATTIAGAGWVLLGLAGGSPADLWAPALFAPAAVALNLLLLPPAALEHPIGRRLAWIPAAALGLAGLLVALVDQQWGTRLGTLALAPLMVWTAWREPRLRLLPFLAALLFLLLLAGWSVQITDWPALTDSPERWRPAAVTDLLATAAVMAGFFAASGLALWSRAPFPLPWASLAASVPVLTLAITYTRVTLFETRFDWAVAAFLLAAGLVGTTAWTMRASRQVAGTQAAGAAASIALGCAMVLSDHWLTVAIALLLPALAWIEAQTDLTPLRHVARAVATVVLVRLLLNWHIADYAYGTTPVVNGVLAAYGVPAACFALAAWLFRRRGDDATVATLQAGSAAFATVLVALEIRHAFSHGNLTGSEPGFGEAALHVASMAVMALVTRRIALRLGAPTAPVDGTEDQPTQEADAEPGATPDQDISAARWREPLALAYAWRIQGGLALLGAVLLLQNNPAFTNSPIGAWPLLNWLLIAYLLPALLAVYAARIMLDQPRALRRGLLAYALVASFVWVTLEIRHWFHGERIGLGRGVEDAELWAWSGAWLVCGAALMILGLRRDERALRLAGIGITMLTTVKVFIVDMSALEGLWRVLSFLGLGLALIGLGAIYQRLARSEPEPVQQGESPGPGGNG